MIVERCDNCKYWKEDKHSIDIGFCHKYPPRSTNAPSLDEIYLWPQTPSNQWCGAYRQKKVDPQS